VRHDVEDCGVPHLSKLAGKQANLKHLSALQHIQNDAFDKESTAFWGLCETKLRENGGILHDLGAKPPPKRRSRSTTLPTTPAA